MFRFRVVEKLVAYKIKWLNVQYKKLLTDQIQLYDSQLDVTLSRHSDLTCTAVSIQCVYMNHPFS